MANVSGIYAFLKKCPFFEGGSLPDGFLRITESEKPQKSYTDGTLLKRIICEFVSVLEETAGEHEKTLGERLKNWALAEAKSGHFPHLGEGVRVVGMYPEARTEKLLKTPKRAGAKEVRAAFSIIFTERM